jgi:hypothetical protein
MGSVANARTLARLAASVGLSEAQPFLALFRLVLIFQERHNILFCGIPAPGWSLIRLFP